MNQIKEQVYEAGRYNENIEQSNKIIKKLIFVILFMK